VNPLSLLRDYQLEGIKDLHRRWDAGATRVPLVLATGLGKTRMAVGITHTFLEANPGKRVLFIVDTDELEEQATRAYRQNLPGVSIGVVKAERNETHARVIVASRQTLASEKRRAQLRNVGLIIVDECHGALRTNTYGKILEHFEAFGQEDIKGETIGPPQCKVVGLTATLVRGDKGKLSTVWEECSFAKDVPYGIRHGYLLDVIGKRVVVPDLNMGNVRQSKGDYRDGDLAEELERTFAPQIIAKAYSEHARDENGELRKGIAFWPLVETAYHGAAAFEEEGIPSAVIHGNLPKLERRLILKRFHAGDVKVVHNCVALKQGFDEPTADVCVIARMTRLPGPFQQMAGRVLRPDLTVPPELRKKALLLMATPVGADHNLRSLVDLSPEHLAGRDYEDGASLLDLDEEWLLEQIGEPNKGGSILLEDELYAGDTEVVAWDPLGRDRNWSRTRGGTWFMNSGKSGYVFLAESLTGDPGTYDALWCERALGGRIEVTQHRGLPIELAMVWAEDEAIERGGADALKVSARNASWRRSRPKAQTEGLARRHGVWRDGMNNGECSDALDVSYASGRIDTLVNTVKRMGQG
jgi:superfamily II DNA or RNA helicase